MKKLLLIVLFLVLTATCSAQSWLVDTTTRTLAADSSESKMLTTDSSQSITDALKGNTKIKFYYAYKVDSVFVSDTVQVSLYGYYHSAPSTASTFRKLFFTDTLTNMTTSYQWSGMKIISTSDSAWLPFVRFEIIYTDSLPGVQADTNLAGNSYNVYLTSQIVSVE